jgi:hypothetical protein
MRSDRWFGYCTSLVQCEPRLNINMPYIYIYIYVNNGIDHKCSKLFVRKLKDHRFNKNSCMSFDGNYWPTQQAIRDGYSRRKRCGAARCDL